MKRCIALIIFITFLAFPKPSLSSTLKPFVQTGHTGWITSVKFSPDGKFGLSGGQDKTLRLWDIATGRELRVFKGHMKDVATIAFTLDGRFALSTSYDKTFRLWDIATGRQLKGWLLKEHKAYLYIAAFSANGKYALTVSNDKILRLWEIATCRELYVFKGHNREIKLVAFSPDGRFALSANRDTFRYWDIVNGKAVKVFQGHPYLWCFAFSPDGKYVISGGADKRLRLWELETGREVKVFKRHKAIVKSVAFSPDGKYVISGGDDNKLRLWEVDTGRELRVFKGHKSSVSSIAFSPDGKYAVSGSWDKTLRLWEIDTGKELRVFIGHKNFVYSVAFSPDGRHIISGSDDNTICLWEVSTARLVRVFKGHTEGVVSATFSQDGRYAISGSRDGRVIFWDVASGKEVVSFYHFQDGEWIVITPEGYFNASPDGAKYVNVRVGPMEVLSIDQFFEQFFNPTLVARVLKGQHVEFKQDIAKGIIPVPEVRIINPKTDETFAEDTIQVEVLAQDMGGGIDEIRLFHNGKVIGEEQRGIQVVGKTKEAKRVYQISLLQGQNVLHAVAFNRDRTESTPYELVVFLKAPSKETALNLLVVGINNYRNPALKLNYAEPDARGIVEFFNQRGGMLFRKVRVTELYDEQATGATIRSRLKGLGNTEPQDAVVIFLAGHGENLNGKWYFIPYEVTYPERDQEVMTKGISSDDIADYVRAMGARKILLLMDSCKAGAALLAFRGYEDRRALMQLARATGVHIVAASTKDQYAAEVKALGHGVFTYTLLDGINGAAATGDQKTITVRRLLAFVEERLPEVSKKYKQEAQYPVVYSRGMDFPLSLK